MCDGTLLYLYFLLLGTWNAAFTGFSFGSGLVSSTASWKKAFLKYGTAGKVAFSIGSIGGALALGYVGAASANNEWNIIKWKGDVNTVIGFLSGSYAGFMTPLTAKTVFNKFKSLKSLPSRMKISLKIVQYVATGLGSTYLIMAAVNREWNLTKWNFTSPSSYQSIFGAVDLALGLPGLKDFNKNLKIGKQVLKAVVKKQFKKDQTVTNQTAIQEAVEVCNKIEKILNDHTDEFSKIVLKEKAHESSLDFIKIINKKKFNALRDANPQKYDQEIKSITDHLRRQNYVTEDQLSWFVHGNEDRAQLYRDALKSQHTFGEKKVKLKNDVFTAVEMDDGKILFFTSQKKGKYLTGLHDPGKDFKTGTENIQGNRTGHRDAVSVALDVAESMGLNAKDSSHIKGVYSRWNWRLEPGRNLHPGGSAILSAKNSDIMFYTDFQPSKQLNREIWFQVYQKPRNEYALNLNSSFSNLTLYPRSTNDEKH